LNVLLFLLAFRLLTASELPWRQLLGRALAAAVGCEVLQLVGSYCVAHVIARASNTYGTFALVIGLLSWIYLPATVILLAAEGNLVAVRRLCPQPLTTAAGRSPRPEQETD
jgi:membrane protein